MFHVWHSWFRKEVIGELKTLRTAVTIITNLDLAFETLLIVIILFESWEYFKDGCSIQLDWMGWISGWIFISICNRPELVILLPWFPWQLYPPPLVVRSLIKHHKRWTWPNHPFDTSKVCIVTTIVTTAYPTRDENYAGFYCWYAPALLLCARTCNRLNFLSRALVPSVLRYWWTKYQISTYQNKP